MSFYNLPGVTQSSFFTNINIITLKSFCLRDQGRLGNEGQSMLLKIGTQSRYVDLCNMPKF